MLNFILGRNNPNSVLKRTTGQGLLLPLAFVYVPAAAHTIQAGVNESIGIPATLPKWTFLSSQPASNLHTINAVSSTIAFLG